MRFSAFGKNNTILKENIYYSIGGGFVVDTDELEDLRNQKEATDNSNVPFPFKKAAEMLAMGKRSGLSILDNETCK
jgi:L-serine dehydratase